MRSQSIFAIKGHHGSVLILALVFTLMLTVISSTAMQNSMLQLRMTGNDQLSHDAYYRAEAIADELSQNLGNFLFDSEVGHSNCPLDPKVFDCDARLLPVPMSAATSEGYEINYRITRQSPLLWHHFHVRDLQGTAASGSSFEAAIFEVDVRMDGVKTRRGSAHVVQGVAVRALLSGDIPSLPRKDSVLYAADGTGGRDSSTLSPMPIRALYRIYWREPSIDPF